MSGFEIIVRPVVFPNIRPAPSRSLPPEDDPESGRATLTGSSGQVIALSHSFTASGTMPGGSETDRTYDVARISERDEDDSGGDARSARAGGDGGGYVDVEVVTQLGIRGADGKRSIWNYAPIEEADNIEIISRGNTRSS
jgi:hypothetical protein